MVAIVLTVMVLVLLVPVVSIAVSTEPNFAASVMAAENQQS